MTRLFGRADNDGVSVLCHKAASVIAGRGDEHLISRISMERLRQVATLAQNRVR